MSNDDKYKWVHFDRAWSWSKEGSDTISTQLTRDGKHVMRLDRWKDNNVKKPFGIEVYQTLVPDNEVIFGED